MKLFVEGGGDSGILQSASREGFRSFITKAGLARRPRIVACGSRRNAYGSFRTAIANREAALLLVDSEAPVAPENQGGAPGDWRPWHHLKMLPDDGWDRPAGAEERHCHLMVQCMESWFIADLATLQGFFGQGFAPRALPEGRPVETIDKAAVQAGLADATEACRTKAPYGKGEHSFKILSSIDPALVVAASPWAARFVQELKVAMAP